MQIVTILLLKYIKINTLPTISVLVCIFTLEGKRKTFHTFSQKHSNSLYQKNE